MKPPRTLSPPAPEPGAAGASLAHPEPLLDVAAAVAHEVANAVGAIAGWAELGLTDGSGVDPRAALSLIASCARTAEQAARRMLDLARGDRPEEAPEPLDASALSNELLQLLGITARQARVAVRSAIEPGLQISAVRGQWFTLLWNLVKNAIEASPPGASVDVSLRAVGDEVVLEVRDAGPGLDQAAQASIFIPYVTTKTQGTGLGLPLVKHTASALAGRIEIDSAPGCGARFRVCVPSIRRDSEVVSAQPERSRPASDEVPKGPQTLSAKILVVDDDPALREMLATALGLRGAQVTTAATSAEASQVQGPFDIALIDMTLDESRGDELLAQLRKRDVVNAAMLVTGTVQKPKLVPGGEPDDWIRKPFEISQIVERIHRTLERHRMLQAVAASARS